MPSGTSSARDEPAKASAVKKSVVARIVVDAREECGDNGCRDAATRRRDAQWIVRY
jgi:hypothetical protein